MTRIVCCLEGRQEGRKGKFSGYAQMKSAVALTSGTKGPSQIERSCFL